MVAGVEQLLQVRHADISGVQFTTGCTFHRKPQLTLRAAEAMTQRQRQRRVAVQVNVQGRQIQVRQITGAGMGQCQGQFSAAITGFAGLNAADLQWQDL